LCIHHCNETVDLGSVVSQSRNIVRVHVHAESASNGFAPFNEIAIGYWSKLYSHWKYKTGAKIARRRMLRVTP
jgi:hypothetical protein